MAHITVPVMDVGVQHRSDVSVSLVVSLRGKLHPRVGLRLRQGVVASLIQDGVDHVVGSLLPSAVRVLAVLVAVLEALPDEILVQDLVAVRRLRLCDVLPEGPHHSSVCFSTLRVFGWKWVVTRIVPFFG